MLVPGLRLSTYRPSGFVYTYLHSQPLHRNTFGLVAKPYRKTPLGKIFRINLYFSHFFCKKKLLAMYKGFFRKLRPSIRTNSSSIVLLEQAFACGLTCSAINTKYNPASKLCINSYFIAPPQPKML